MAMLRINVTGSNDQVRAISNLLNSLEGIEHVEEVADLMPHLDDDDSSSAGLSDLGGPQMHSIEIEVGNESTADKVRAACEILAAQFDAVIEVETDPEAFA